LYRSTLGLIVVKKKKKLPAWRMIAHREVAPACERNGNHSKRFKDLNLEVRAKWEQFKTFKDLNLKVKTIIWP